MLVTEHKVYPDPKMAAAASIKAGINQFLDRYREGTEGALASGLLIEADIDASLRGVRVPTPSRPVLTGSDGRVPTHGRVPTRVFRVMVKLGLLDPPEGVPYNVIGQEGEPEPWLERCGTGHSRAW